MQPYCEVPTRP